MNSVRLIIIAVWGMCACTPQTNQIVGNLSSTFVNPPNEYRPMPFWHLNGQLTKEGIEQRIIDAKDVSGFGGVTVLPISPGPQHPTGLLCPGMEPRYLSEEYFIRYSDMLRVSAEIGTEIILYDDIDFPSGTAGGKLVKEFPEYTRKYLIKDEALVKGGKSIHLLLPNPEHKVVMAVSAMNISTLEIVDLEPYLRDSRVEWTAPEGDWRIMFFSCRLNLDRSLTALVDYMQPEAVAKVIEFTYDEYDKRFGRYFGSVITKTFYDDVGFVHQENTWTPAITTLFKEKYDKNPALYYPALYYDIGEETEKARVAFFDIRSELMAEGYVRQVAEWSAKRNLKSMGHPPENYSPNSVVAHGDILKYYRHSQIPLLDAIFYYGRGVNGFKQITSAADLGDKPVVGAELCGAFPSDMDSLTLFRTTLDALVRGVNFVTPHGMWYDTNPSKVRIPPVISNENPLLAPCLQRYSANVARSCAMLQGGNRVCDIALLWPIAAIQGGSTIGKDDSSGLPVANWLPEYVNHYQISGILTNEVRRDFTYIHPENLCDGKVTILGTELHLNNKENFQNYKVLILPGGDVISASTLKVIKRYYDNGGKVIATASLPRKSSEFGQDVVVQTIIKEIFGTVPDQSVSTSEIWNSNSKGGQAVFLPLVSEKSFEQAFDRMNLIADVCFDNIEIEGTTVGSISYTHKQKAGKNIYFLTNTTEQNLESVITLRGKINNLEYWYPDTGGIEKAKKVEFVTKKGETYTKVAVALAAVSSIFIVGDK